MPLSFSKGFSTVELLIAMAVLALVLSAVVLLALGGQSLLADAQSGADAFDYAHVLLQNEQALAQEDFALIQPATTTEEIGPILYTGHTSVTVPGYFIKEVTATVSWTSSYNRSQSVSLTTFITNYAHAVGGDTCGSVLAGDWSALHIKNSTTNFAQLVDDPTGAYLLTDAAAHEGRLYVTQNNSSSNKETFFIFDISDPTNPTLLSKLDNDAKHASGLNAVVIATSSAGSYAYVASASSFVSGQLQIIDIHNPQAPALLTTFKIPTSTVPVAGVGKSIFYANGYVYEGLAKSAGGKEFNIIDVHDPLHPQWIGGYSVGNDINSIYVEGSYAYIASPNSKNLLMLDISNPAAPTLAGSYTPVGGSNGEVVKIMGTTAYLGRTYGTNEFYLLNVPASATVSPITAVGDIDLGIGSGTSVQGFVVRGYLAFLLTNAQLQMVSVDTPSTPTLYGTPLSLPSGSGGTGIALACDGDYLYALSDLQTTSYLSVIHP